MHPSVVRTWPWVIVGALILGVLRVSPAAATFLPEIPIPDLWANADCVIEAHVDSTRAEWDVPSGLIVTRVHLDVLAVHQGSCVTGLRTLTVAGGVVDSVGLAIPLAPTFASGEHVLLFLDEHPGLLMPVLAMDQGKFTIEPEPVGGTLHLRNRLHHSIPRGDVLGRLRGRPGR